MFSSSFLKIDLGRAMFIVCLVVYLSISASFDCSPDRNKMIKSFKSSFMTCLGLRMREAEKSTRWRILWLQYQLLHTISIKTNRIFKKTEE